MRIVETIHLMTVLLNEGNIGLLCYVILSKNQLFKVPFLLSRTQYQIPTFRKRKIYL